MTAEAGLSADLKFTSGDITATLPYHVDLNSTYNKTTDTLQIMANDVALSGGQFTAHGPSGSFTVGLFLGLQASGAATILGTGTKFKTTAGSFTKPAIGLKVSSSTLGKSFTIFQADGLQDVTLAKMTLAFPTVDTN